MKTIIKLLLLLVPFLSFAQRSNLYKGLASKVYYKNGNLRVERQYDGGKILSYKTFYKSGAIQSNFIFNEKGRHDSIANFYYPNGNVKTEWKYKKGVVKKRIDYTLDGEVVKGKKDYDKIRKLNQYIAQDRNDLTKVFKRGKLNSKLGFHDHALEDFNFIISKLKPRLVRQSSQRSIYHVLAINYTQTEDYEKALKYNYKALAIQSDNQSVLNNLGWLLIRAKDYDLALSYLDKCHEVNPENHYAFSNKATIYLEKGDYKKALSFIEKAIADKRSHKLSKRSVWEERTIWATRGEIYYRLGRLDEAIKDLEKALEENPVNSYAYRCLALVYKAKDQNNEACNSLALAKEYKYDKAYDTNEIEVLENKYCNSK